MTTTTIFVRYGSELLSSSQSPEPYGSWHRNSSFEVKGVGLTSNFQANEIFTVDFESTPGDTVHVLWMTYSSGDSFGESSGNGEIIWVFKDAVLAEKAYAKWDEARRNRDKRDTQHDAYYSIEFEVDGGETVKLTNPAWGYFERMETLQVQSFVVEQNEQQED